jgi:phosphomannomutase
MSPGISFGTDGWRGLMSSDFTDRNVRCVADALYRSLKKNTPSIAIGFDGRKDSDHFAAACAEVLACRGATILLSPSVIPTPVLSFAVRHFQCDAGIMITASHNPPEYNGIKFKGPYGGPYMTEQTKEVEALLPAEPPATASAAAQESIRKVDFLPSYFAHLKEIVDVKTLASFADGAGRNPGIIIDSMGGAGQTLLEEFLAPLGWRAQTIFGEAEPTFFGRAPEPVERNLGPLLYNTGVTESLVGIATDGDADRCGVVFADGTWMNAQETILALLYHLHTYRKQHGAIVKTASVTDKVRLMAERWNETLYEVHVGFKYIAEVMLAHNCVFGGEESGGFGYGMHIPERDGILSGLLFAEMLAKSGRSLIDIVEEIRRKFGTLHYARIDASYIAPDRSEILPRLAVALPASLGGLNILGVRKYEELGNLTGLKYLCGDSRWLLIRTSQTEPIIRCYAEGQSEAEVTALLNQGKLLTGAEEKWRCM